MSEDLIITIVVGVLGVVSMIFGAQLAKAKNVIKELKEFFEAIEEALADGKIDRLEAKTIAGEGKDIINVFLKKED